VILLVGVVVAAATVLVVVGTTVVVSADMNDVVNISVGVVVTLAAVVGKAEIIAVSLSNG